MKASNDFLYDLIDKIQIIIRDSISEDTNNELTKLIDHIKASIN